MCRVLIVDDSRAIRGLLAGCLTAHGFSPVDAELGEDALRLAVEDPPLAAIIDYHLPDMNGADAVKLLRAVPSLRWMPVIGLSAGRGSEQALMEAGAACFVAKPFRDNDVLKALRWALAVYGPDSEPSTAGLSASRSFSGGPRGR